MEKSKRIKKEEKRLNSIFRDVEENKKRTVEGLIKRAAFMRASLWCGIKKVDSLFSRIS